MSGTAVTGNGWISSSGAVNDLDGSTAGGVHQWYYDGTVYTPSSAVLGSQINLNNLGISTSNTCSGGINPNHTVTVSGRERKLGSIIRGENQYDTLSQQYLIHDTIYAFRIMSKDTAMLNLGAQDDSLYHRFFNIASQENYGKFEQVNQHIFAGDINSAIAVNNTIIPENDIETNQQAVNSIWVQKIIYDADTTHLLGYSYDANQRTVLHDIAVQHPMMGGEAVYQARTMLWIDVENPEMNLSRAHIAIKPAENMQNTYKLYPNPNTGSMMLEYNIVTKDPAVFEIYDVSGRLVKQQNLNLQNTYTIIDANELNNGLYYYIIKSGDKKEKAEKLVIVK